MKKSQRFSTLADLALNKEQAAAVALGTSNRVHAENLKKLESLKQYRQEYLNRLNKQGQQGMDVSAMQTYKGFIDGIEQAINQQQLQIIESQQQCEQSKKIWQHVHMKTEIMNTTVDRYKKMEVKEADHRDQKEQDDRPYKKSPDSI